RRGTGIHRDGIGRTRPMRIDRRQDDHRHDPSAMVADRAVAGGDRHLPKTFARDRHGSRTRGGSMQRNRMTALALALGMVFPAAAGAGERTGVPGGDWADIQSRGRLLHEHQRALLLAEQRAGASATFRSDARPLTAVSEKTGSSEITVTFADA